MPVYDIQQPSTSRQGAQDAMSAQSAQSARAKANKKNAQTETNEQNIQIISYRQYPPAEENVQITDAGENEENGENSTTHPEVGLDPTLVTYALKVILFYTFFCFFVAMLVYFFVCETKSDKTKPQMCKLFNNP